MKIDAICLLLNLKGIRREGKSLCDVGGENKTVDFCPDTYTAINVYKNVVLGKTGEAA